MSRGPGRIMIAVEQRLTAEPQPVADLAATVFRVDRNRLTRAQIESVRQACKRLAKRDRAHVTRIRQEVKAYGGRGSSQRVLAAHSAHRCGTPSVAATRPRPACPDSQGVNLTASSI